MVELTASVITLLSVLIALPAVLCRREDDVSATLLIDPATKHATGSFSCSEPDELLDIGSLEYYYESTPCDFTCPTRTADFLDGTNQICKNENIITSTCYARNICYPTNITQPYRSCYGNNNKATRVRVNFRCIHRDYVFNLCEERAVEVNRETPIILTTPLSQQKTYNRLSCQCVLSSVYPNQIINSDVILTHLRMPQLLKGDNVQLLTNRGPLNSYTQPYDERFLPVEQSIAIGGFEVEEASVILNNSNILTGDSRVFQLIEPGKDLLVSCNGAITGGTQPTTVARSTLSPDTSPFTKDPEKLVTNNPFPIQITSVPSSTTATINSVLSTADEGTTIPEVMTSPKDTDSQATTVIVIIVVLVVPIVILAVVVIFLIKRSRRERGKKYAAGLSENNNVELSPLQPSAGVVANDDTYHVLDDTEGAYDEIRSVDGFSDTDPYKVTNLEEDPPASHYYQRDRNAAANEYVSHGDGMKKSGSNPYAAGSSVTEEHYSEPFDVATGGEGDKSTTPCQMKKSGSNPYAAGSSVTEEHYSEPFDVATGGEGDKSTTPCQYDVPAEVTYSTINKPVSKSASVELIENELYGSG